MVSIDSCCTATRHGNTHIPSVSSAWHAARGHKVVQASYHRGEMVSRPDAHPALL